nr:cytochrome c oxidase assembly protein [Tepidiforma thermophila]
MARCRLCRRCRGRPGRRRDPHRAPRQPGPLDQLPRVPPAHHGRAALLLLGAPLTLAFRVASPAGRRRLRALYRSRLAAVLTFPVFTWLLFAVLTYLWQFTRLTDLAAEHGLLRDFQLASLLLTGLLFWMPALAIDPLAGASPTPSAPSTSSSK